MHRSRWIVVLGALVALVPLSGLPLAGKNFLVIVCGLSIVGLSVWSQIDKKISMKAKAHMRATRKVAFVPEVSEPTGEVVPKVPPVTPTFGKRVTDFYPKTGQPGRRAVDLKPTPAPQPAPDTSAEESVI